MKPQAFMLFGLLVAISAFSGCDYGADNSGVEPAGAYTAGVDPTRATVSDPKTGELRNAVVKREIDEEEQKKKATILESVINLIQTAALKPGGDNFGNAVENLNQYFLDITEPQDYLLRSKTREFLARQMPPEMIKEVERTTFNIRDARHLEDCMLYYGIANRVGGVGDDLARVRRVFDWMVRQVQLVPEGALGVPPLTQAMARPYDVLLRGMATEGAGSWSERSWLFMSLCRQLGLDSGLITFVPKGSQTPVIWAVGVLINKQVYLFDARVGIAIPAPDGEGVATLVEAMSDPGVLERMSLPGQSSYAATRDAIRSSPGKLIVLLDSGSGYFTPRMRLLERNLTGKSRVFLFRDPAEQRQKFVEAMGDALGEAALWSMPLQVEQMLFTDARFVQSTQLSLVFFDSKFPLLYARVKQLRGEIPQAIKEYVAMRLAESPTLMDRKTPMPAEVQKGIDIYSTYFLGQAHLELALLNPAPKTDFDTRRAAETRKHLEQAEFFFSETLRMTPLWSDGLPFYYLFRWGAHSNLGRLADSRGDFAHAASYYSVRNPTFQRHGNLLRARDMILNDPFSPTAAPLPTPPAAPSVGDKAASTTATPTRIAG